MGTQKAQKYTERLCWWVCVCLLVCVSSCTNLRKENERLREELAKAQQYVPLKRDTIRDTVEVVTQKVVEVEKVKEVLTSADRQLLKDLGMKVKELESLQKTGMVTKDTVWLEPSGEPSGTVAYHDVWTDFILRDRRLEYAVRDSLAVAVKKEYRHRFLWWKWGTKGYDVKVVNFNPHATIKYNTYIKRRQ